MVSVLPAQAAQTKARARPAAAPVAAPPAAAAPAGRKVVLVAPVQADAALQARLPTGYSPDALRRELEVALETTGLFTATTRDSTDLDPVLREMALNKRPAGSAAQRSVLQSANLILNPTVEALSLVERRRRTPAMRDKDTVAASGSVSLTVQVLSNTGAVQTRMQIDATYQGPERLADPLVPDPLVRASVFNGPPTPEEFRALYQEMGRAFAKRVLDQVNPTVVAQVSADKVYLTRGEDAGYQVGDLLRLVRPGVEIIDPVTKEVLDRTDDEIGQIKVIEVRPRVTVGQVVKSTKDAVIGDLVREPVPVRDPSDN
jgi:hypothetical protein